MHQATAGDIRLVNVRALYHRFFGVCGFVFFVGVFIGGYVSREVYAGSGYVSQALVGLGEHLCKQWDGLREIGRIDKTHYVFRCRTLAVFPNVEVTLEGG